MAASDLDLDPWHLYRRYPSKPFRRYAMTVVQDPDADDGYRITDSDPAVADSSFMAQFARAMHQPAVKRDSEETKEAVFETIEEIGPSDPEYFEHRIRQLDFADFGPAPKH